MACTLSKSAMYNENPNWSSSPIFSANCWHNSLAVVAESARRVFVLPAKPEIDNVFNGI